MEPAPTIAIVGRPNVGKSTIFNRLIGKKHAIVSEVAGTTRDRIYQKFDCNGYHCSLIDTGGLQSETHENIEENVQKQAQLAIAEANIILFVVDNRQELNSDDYAAADILRKSKKPVIIVSNKADYANLETQSYNFYELGFGSPIPVSAIHKLGIEILQDEIEKYLKELKFKKRDHLDIKKKSQIPDICILGQPNAGKSSLINALTGFEKIIVSDIPGTTRDTIDSEISYHDKIYNLIDTAGIRKPGKIEKGLEKFSILRCLSAIKRSDIAILLIDGTKGISHQDCHIAKYILEEKKGLIIAITKIDLFAKGEEIRNDLLFKLQQKFAFVPWAPIIFISVKNKKNLTKILDLTDDIMKEREKRITTGELNSYLQRITLKHLPASNKLRKPKFMYGSQVDINPPKFVLFFKNAKNLHFSYPRYIENAIRKQYCFNGTTIDLKLKESITGKSNRNL